MSGRSARGAVFKWLGVAGIAGVAATGVLVARAERQRRSYTPEDIRARLHERADGIRNEPTGHPGPAETG